MAFHDVRLPEDVEKGAVGGPRFKTTILGLSSGFEKRNMDWENIRGFWDIGYGIQTKEDFSAVMDFFYGRRGRAHSFRYQDWSDYEVAAQTIGTTDGSTATFQLFKEYDAATNPFNRNLEKPVGSGWTVTLGVSQTVVYDVAPTGFEVSINTLTGVLTLAAAHAAGSGIDIVVSGTFDVPVRFDTDALDISLATFEAGAIPSLPVIEVRGE